MPERTRPVEKLAQFDADAPRIKQHFLEKAQDQPGKLPLLSQSLLVDEGIVRWLIRTRGLPAWHARLYRADNWGDVILPTDQLRLLNEIVDTIRRRPKVLDEWQMERLNPLTGGYEYFAEGSTSERSVGVSLGCGKYRWRVRAVDGAGNNGAFSTWQVIEWQYLG